MCGFSRIRAMYAEFATRKKEIANLCRGQGVARLEVFGSAARGTDPATSDADFLVEFDPSQDPSSYKHPFAFENALADALGREVDVISGVPKNE